MNFLKPFVESVCGSLHTPPCSLSPLGAEAAEALHDLRERLFERSFRQPENWLRKFRVLEILRSSAFRTSLRANIPGRLSPIDVSVIRHRLAPLPYRL